MTCAHDLLWLTFSTVRGSPEDPAFLVADCVAGVPELWGNSRIARASNHLSQAAILYPVSFLTVELEVVSLLVDAPPVVCIHEYPILCIFYQLIVVPVSRFQAHVCHANDLELVGICPHAPITPILPNLVHCPARH